MENFSKSRYGRVMLTDGTRKYLCRKAMWQKTIHVLSYCAILLEYASELWDGCNQTDADRLEKIQLNAARIVTGLPIFSSLSSLYFETGWETLADRRKSKKLNLMYKIINNDSPSYLVDLLPYRVQEISNYNLRSRENFDVPFSIYVHMKLHSFRLL